MATSDLVAGAAALFVFFARGGSLAKRSRLGTCARMAVPLLLAVLWKHKWLYIWRDWWKRSRARTMRRSRSEQSQTIVSDPFQRLQGGMDAFEDMYDVGRRITDSTFGCVFECRYKHGLFSADNKAVVKIVPRAQHPLLRNDSGRSTFGSIVPKKQTQVVEPNSFWSYMHKLLSLNHENVVNYQAFYADSFSFYFVMESCPGRTMVDYLFTQETWREKDVRPLVGPLLKGLSYIHKMKLGHRDLKLTNIMVEQAEGAGDERQIKLLDFGLGFHGKCGHGAVGTLGYMAPEVFGSDAYTCSVDMFSSGVILYILLTGRPPFRPPIDMRRVEDHVEELESGPSLSGPPFHFVSRPAVDLLDWLLHPDPRARCSADEALRHSWFRARMSPRSTGSSSSGPALWESTMSELRFLKIMGVWSGSSLGSRQGRRHSRTSSKGSLGCITEAEGETADDFMDELFSRIVRKMTVPVAISDPSKPDSPLVAVSKGFEALTGYRQEDVLGRNCRFLNSSRAREINPDIRSQLRDAARASRKFLGCVPNVRADGSHFENLLHLTPLDVMGQVVVVGVQMEVPGPEADLESHEIIGVAQKVHATIRQWLRSPVGHANWGRSVSY